MPEERSVPKAIGLMCCAGLFFGISSALIKGAGAGLPTFEVTFFRSGVGFLILLCMFLFRHPRVSLGKRKWLLFWRAILGTVATITYVWGIGHIDLGLANGLNQTSPIFVCLFAAIFLGERFGWQTYLCVFLAFIGILLIVAPDLNKIHVESLVALFSGIVSASAYTIVRTLQKTETTETVVFWFLGIATFSSLLFYPVETWEMPSVLCLCGLLLAGLVAFGGQMLMTRAYHFAEATIVAPFIYVSTISSLFIAFFVWGELPGGVALTGCAIVIVASVVEGLFSRRRLNGGEEAVR